MQQVLPPGPQKIVVSPPDSPEAPGRSSHVKISVDDGGIGPRLESEKGSSKAETAKGRTSGAMVLELGQPTRPSVAPATRPSAMPGDFDDDDDQEQQDLDIETQSIPEMDSVGDMEHVMGLRPSLHTTLLTEILENS